MGMAGAVLNRPRAVRAFKVLVAFMAFLPLAILLSRLVGSGLGPDPGQQITESLGIAAFQLLLATLALTPLKRWTGWVGWLRVRRMLGLFTFFYAVLHLLAFLQFILGWGDVWATFTKRPYIIAGFLAFVLLIPLAVTSTNSMMRRLGRRWKTLHRSVYVIVLLAWVHFFWQARSDIGEMLAYGVVVLVLLAVRVRWSRLLRAGRRGAPSA